MFYNFKKHQLRFVTVVSVIVIVVVGFNLFMRPHHLILSSNPCDLHAWFHTKLLLRDLHQGHRAARRGCCCLCRSWHRAWHCGTVPSTGEAQWGGESQQREHYTTIRHDAAEVVTMGWKPKAKDRDRDTLWVFFQMSRMGSVKAIKPAAHSHSEPVKQEFKTSCPG